MLIGMEYVREVIETVILTGRLKNHSPVSFLMIAPPESGKTSVVLARPCKSVIALTDVTSGGLRELCKSRPEISHLIINDMVAVSAHRSSVVGATIAMLNAMTEEGIMATAYPGSIETHENGKRAIIASIPDGMVNDKRSWWNKSGFSSRMIPFNFTHSSLLRAKVKTQIKIMDGKAHSSLNEKPFLIPDIPLTVKFDKKIADDVGSMSEETLEKGDIGYRRLKQFLAMCAAHAVRRHGWKDTTVTTADVEFIERLMPFVSFHRTEKI